ncbi:hypothetical protein [Actinoplanes derwentensis]|uniref:hypothetical protein n=1 Tax=Actinoplanes derwentensis TaxID=113562 RepID=UPI0012FDC614|nr:hypothetical protein [Actinoplanes derwentensis]
MTREAIDGFGIAARVLAGGGSVALGLYLGGMNNTAYEADWRVSVFSAVVIVGGVLLIALARRGLRTSRAGRISGTAAGAVGVLAGMVTPIQETCCDAVWVVSLGLPLPWTIGHGDTWTQAFQDSWHGTWDPVSAFSNVLFWAYAGMIVAVVVDLLRRRSDIDRVGAS